MHVECLDILKTQKDTLCFVSVCFVISINYQKTSLKEDSAQGTDKYIFSEKKCYDDHT